MNNLIELGSRIRYECRIHDANGDSRVTEQGEATILSSQRDTKDLPMWSYLVSPSNEPVLTDHYPFEDYPDAITIWEDQIIEIVEPA